MEMEKLCFKGKPIRPEEQKQALAIYLAILEALIKLDLKKTELTRLVCVTQRSCSTNILTRVVQYKRPCWKYVRAVQSFCSLLSVFKLALLIFQIIIIFVYHWKHFCNWKQSSHQSFQILCLRFHRWLNLKGGKGKVTIWRPTSPKFTFFAHPTILKFFEFCQSLYRTLTVCLCFYGLLTTVRLFVLLTIY